MPFNTRCLLATTLLALAANACAASTARVVRSSEAPQSCAGGVIRSARDAASYAGCTTVNGDLTIESSELTNLRYLESLRNVSGALTITDNRELISLRGLNGLKRAGSVRIRNNRQLCAPLGFLPQLGEVTEALVLSSNPSLSKQEIAGLLEHVTAPLNRPARASREVALH